MDSSGRIRDQKKLGHFQTILTRDTPQGFPSQNSPAERLIQIPDVSSQREGDEMDEMSPIKITPDIPLGQFFSNQTENKFLVTKNCNNDSLGTSKKSRSRIMLPRRESLQFTPVKKDEPRRREGRGGT